MHRPLLVLFGFLALCVSSLRAEEGKTDAPKSEAKPAPGSALVWNGQSTAKWYIDSIEKIVPLTEVQRQGMTDIMNARDKAVAEWQTQNAGKLQAAQKAMMDAYQGKDSALENRRGQR